MNNTNESKECLFDENFKKWLEQQNLSDRTINNYIKAVKKVNYEYKYDGSDYSNFIKRVKGNQSFTNLNNLYHNTFSCGMEKYLLFLKEKQDVSCNIQKDNINIIQINSILGNLSYTKPFRFDFDNNTYSVNNWTDYIVNLVKCLIEYKPNVQIRDFKFSQTQRVLWSNTGEEFLAPKQISNDLFIETNYSGTAICKMSIEMLKYYEVDNNCFKLYLVSKQNNEEQINWEEIDINQTSKYSFSIPTKIKIFGNEKNVNSWLEAFCEISNILIDNNYHIDINFTFVKNEPNDYDKDHYGTKILKNGKYLQTPYVVSIILKYILVVLKYNDIKFDQCQIFYKNRLDKKSDTVKEKSVVPTISENEKHQLRNCYINNFKHGYRLGSVIEYRRLMNYYSENYSGDIQISQSNVEKILMETSIRIDDKIIDEENILSNEILNKIVSYIDDKFNNNYYMLYYKDIYEKFSDELITTNISNEMVLKEYLIKKYFNKYLFEKTYFQSKTNLMNLDDEIDKIFKAANNCLTIQQIQDFFVGVSEDKIKQILFSNRKYINVSRNTFCGIEQFKYNKRDIEDSLKVVENLIKKEGFAIRDKVISILQQTNPSFISDNLVFGNVGICKMLEILFNNNIRFSRYVFMYDGQDVSFSSILLNSVKENENITMQQLQAISEEIGINLSKYYLSDILKEFARIDENEFIKRDLLCFDVEKIDGILAKYTSDYGYISFKDINNYSQFPAIGYSWNQFLLEDYINNYSKQFNIETDSNSINKVVGFIVNRKLGIKNFDSFIEKVLMDSKINFKSKEEILNYLYEIRLIGKRRYQNIDEICKRINV